MAELVRSYFKERAPAWTPVSVVTTGQKLRHLTTFFEGRYLTWRSVVAFLAHVRNKKTPRGAPWAQATIAGVLGSVQGFLKWAALRGHVLEDLASLVEVPKVHTLPKALSEPDVMRLLEAPQKGRCPLRDQAIVELFYGTGLRASELARLQVSDVDLSEGVVLVRQGKGRKDRVVPLGACATRAVQSYLTRERPRRPGPLFLLERGAAITSKAAGSAVYAAGQRAGLSVPASPHKLRHSVATHLLRHGASLVEIKELLGHASLSSTQVYTAVDVQDLAKMLEKSHPRGKTKGGV